MFLAFNCVVTTLMYYEIIATDLGPIHRYATNFNIRTILVLVSSVVLQLFLADCIKKKKEYCNVLAQTVLIFLCIFTIDTCGNFFGWYSVGLSYSVIWYDNMAHVVIPFLMVLCAYNLLHYQYKTVSKNLLILLASCISMSIGAVWEFFEYYSDLYLNTYMVGGLEDVETDLLYNSIGAIGGYLMLMFVTRKGKR